MLEHTRHLPRGRRHTSDSHYGLPIDLQNLVGTIVDDSVTRSRTAISRHQNAPGKFESQNRGRVAWLPGVLLPPVLCHRTDDRGAQQTFASQERSKIVRCTRKVLVKSQL